MRTDSRSILEKIKTILQADQSDADCVTAMENLVDSYTWSSKEMPNCFQLYPKGSNEPAILQQVDDRLREHFEQPPDPKHWLADWYHVIGFLIACKDGCSLGSDKLRAEIHTWYTTGLYLNEPDHMEYLANMLQILDYLEANYTSNAWVEIGKR
jgi:hypothetical protein